MNRYIVTTLMLLFALATSVSSLPRFALLSGAKCGSCHINPTGGQMRSEYGTSFSTDKLPLEALKDSDFAFSSKLTDNISIGGDYRSQFIYDFAADPSDNVKGKYTFHTMTTTLYGAIRLSKKVTFYYKQDIINPFYEPFSGPEVYGIARILPNNWYIKGGAFLPDYGWRLDDHTGYTRGGNVGIIPGGISTSGLLFIPNYRDIGVEVGGYIGNLMMTAAWLNGSGNARRFDFSRDKAYVAKAEYMGSASELNFRFGGSFYGYRNSKMGGLHAGVGFNDLAILGEIDWSVNYLSLQGAGYAIADGVNALAAYGELDYRAIQGLWLTGKFDMFDPQQGVADNELKRITLGFEFFPYSFVEVRPQYRLNIETPSVDNDQAIVQMHVWF